MREKLEIIVGLVAAELTSFYIVIFLLKEKDMLRVWFGTVIISLAIFGIILWLFTVAKIREKRKHKKKSIDQLSLD